MWRLVLGFKVRVAPGATGATGERALLAGLPIPKTRQHGAPFRAPVYKGTFVWMNACVTADSGGKSVHQTNDWGVICRTILPFVSGCKFTKT